MTARAAIAVAIGLAACKQETIEVHRGASADYNRAPLIAAIDKFVATGRTPAAYGELAKTVVALRPGMDAEVAREAELRLIVLALAPVQSVQSLSLDGQRDALALTVWPTLLTPAVQADTLLTVRDPRAPELVPKPGEEPGGYLERLCGGPLAGDCKRVVPEDQSAVIDAFVLRRATERARNAVAECERCTSERADPGWATAVAGWEVLDRGAAAWVPDAERRSDPANWPVAGAASDDDPGLPEAELSAQGELVIGEHRYGPNQQRIAVLRELRGSSDALAFHLRPSMTLEQVRGLLVDARRAGCSRVAVVAREPVYPWRRKAYWIAAGAGLRANLRPTDSLQLLVHSIDEVAGPGTVARVD